MVAPAPFTGSGTIPIEAALIARSIAPGLASGTRGPRRYAFERWRDHDLAGWERVVDAARSEIRDRSPVAIFGSDRDEGAIEAAGANAARAGVAADIDFDVRALSAIEPPPLPGWLITNPPYGVRIGEVGPLRDLYSVLGRLCRTRFQGWGVALLAAEERLIAATELDLQEVARTRNGGIDVRMLVAGRKPDAMTQNPP